MRGELCRIGNNPKLLLLPARDEGQPDVIDLRDFGAQPHGKSVQRGFGPFPAHRHLRRLHPGRQFVHVGRQPLVDSGRGIVGVRSDEETRGDHHPVIFGLRVDMLDPVDAFDDRLERLADDFDRIARRQAGGGNHQIDHRDADLRLLLARDRHDREQPDKDCREQHQGGQRALDRRAGQPPGDTEIHLRIPACTAISVSPLAAPERISTRAGSSVGAICTGTRDVASLPTRSVT